MSKTVHMSQSVFIISSAAFILIGATITGIPLFSQAKNYYNQVSMLETNLSEKERSLKSSLLVESKLINDYNIAVKDRNRLLKAIESVDGDVPQWDEMECKNEVTGMAVSC